MASMQAMLKTIPGGAGDGRGPRKDHLRGGARPGPRLPRSEPCLPPPRPGPETRPPLPPSGRCSGPWSRGISRPSNPRGNTARPGSRPRNSGRGGVGRGGRGRGQAGEAGRARGAEGRGWRDLWIAGVSARTGPGASACAHAPCAGSRSERRSPAARAPVPRALRGGVGGVGGGRRASPVSAGGSSAGPAGGSPAGQAGPSAEVPLGHTDTERGVAPDSVTGEGPPFLGRDRQEDSGRRTSYTPGTRLMAGA
ncbi:collagen alpha-1(I) chain-like [Phyllostomus discolor]|uniref:Collagen alpha-1(I) chain-like n=1 Tax=Phyllostomus discolor TaxID=89673 RepID=A0A7E6EGU7_9CHIR|nr:collagen alpha-1(I) chain-like [Phyllostomus discolor]